MSLGMSSSLLIVWTSSCLLGQVSSIPSPHRRNSKRMMISEAPTGNEYIQTDLGRESRMGRQIQPLACVSKGGDEKGVCMFAWNCVESGGKHLGTCIDRFYFGSCCQLPTTGEVPVVPTGEEDVNADKLSDNEISDEAPLPSKKTTTTRTPSTSTTTASTTTTTVVTSSSTTSSTTTTTSTTTITITTTTITTTYTTTSTTSTSTITTTSTSTTTTTTTSTTTTTTTTSSTTWTDTTSTTTTTTTTSTTSTTTTTNSTWTDTSLPYISSSESTSSTSSSSTSLPPATTNSNNSTTDIAESSTTDNPLPTTTVAIQETTNSDSTVTNGEELSTFSTDYLLSTDVTTDTTEKNTDLNTVKEDTDTTDTTTDLNTTKEDTDTADTTTDLNTNKDNTDATTDLNFVQEDTTKNTQTDLLTSVGGEEQESSSTDSQETTTNTQENYEETSTVTKAVYETTTVSEISTDDAIVLQLNLTEGADLSVLPVLSEDDNVTVTEPPGSEQKIDPVVIEAGSTDFNGSSAVNNQAGEMPSVGNWVPIKVENGQMKPIQGIGGAELKPGQFYNCSVISEEDKTYNCTIVAGPSTSGTGGLVTNDLSDIQNAIAAATGGSFVGEPIIIEVDDLDGPEAPAGPVVTPAPTGDTDTATTKDTDISSVKNPSASTEKPVHSMTFKEACGRQLWLNETYRSSQARPRSGRMIGEKHTLDMMSIVNSMNTYRGSRRKGKIVNGQKAEYGEWPWQVSLRQWRTATFLHKCGAALLSENWAITAAHCVESVNPDELLLRMGEYDLNDEFDEPHNFQDRKVQIVASHPKFDPKTFEYDLALLRFYEPVVFQPNIIPVCVPEDDDSLVGSTAWVTGWGRLYEDGPLPAVLQEVDLPIINNTECEAMYEKAGFREHIPHIFICAGYREGGKDSCEGDSGGPMAVKRSNGRFDLAGVISWGIGCAKRNQPGVMTRIAYFRDWINTIIKF